MRPFTATFSKRRNIGAVRGCCCVWPWRQRPEVHFNSLLTVFGARRAPRGPLGLAIYGVWGQESAPRSTLTRDLRCLMPG
eukprot:13343624-Heterocapsa_arctica.AAC.1